MSVLIFDAKEGQGPINLEVRVGGGPALSVIGSCICRDEGTGELLEPTSKGKSIWKFRIDHSFYTVTSAVRNADKNTRMQLVVTQGVRPPKPKSFDTRQGHDEFRVATGGVSIR